MFVTVGYETSKCKEAITPDNELWGSSKTRGTLLEITNGEIVIGNKEFLLAYACSAGPAFEGSGIRCGMRASSGAIDSFKISLINNQITYTTIENQLPKGICGSGLICLLGELVNAHFIDRSGKFTDNASAMCINLDSTPAFILVPANLTPDNEPILITESYIGNLIRTKAAIYAACDLMSSNIGVDISNVEQILIAGGFEKYIDINQSVTIGLFPDIERNKYRYLGNTSLASAALVLRSKKHQDMLTSISQKITYVELSNDPQYMNSYVSALFLPHTDLSRFPSGNF
jgi:uncharacterized 2Fe-2S/4Fe-4S cluster protein (DUF4445 family)